MASHMTVYTTYHSGGDFGGTLKVSKFSVGKVGRSKKMVIEFVGGDSIKSARIYLEPELAIPLARSLLSVAEGYVSDSKSEVA